MNTVDKYVRSIFRARGIGHVLPRLARTDRIQFAKMFGNMEFNKGVEIGTREGKHALILCQQNPNIELTCIDPWLPHGRWDQDWQTKFEKKTKLRTSPYNVKLLKMTSMVALNKFKDRSLDFAYIDGDHSLEGAMMDLFHWTKKVRLGGIIACHDYCHAGSCGGVVLAVDAFTQFYRIAPWYVTRDITPTAFWVNK